LAKKGLQLKETWMQQTTLAGPGKAFKASPGPKSLITVTKQTGKSFEMGVGKREPRA
jgi:hypothetical protein